MPSDLTWCWFGLFFEGFLVALFSVFITQFIYDKVSDLFTKTR
jgi:hypothetical protein